MDWEYVIENLPAGIRSAAGLAVPAVLALLMHWIVFAVASRRAYKTQDLQLISLVKNLHGPTQLILLVVALMFGLRLTDFTGSVLQNSQSVLILGLIASIAWLAIRSLVVGRDFVLGRYKVDVADNLAARRIHTQFRVIHKVLTVLILLVALAVMLATFEQVRAIGVSLLASAGIIGVVLGFSAQRTLATLFAGIQIAIPQPIRLDDVVIVEGEWGWIEEITLTYVVVKIWDLRRLVVPITYFIEKPFQNWTRVSADLLGTVFIYTDYTVPFNEVREELRRILESTELWDKKVCVLQVTDATQQTLELRALMSSEDSPKGWDLRCYVREKLLDFLKQKFPKALPRTRVELSELKKEGDVPVAQAKPSTGPAAPST